MKILIACHGLWPISSIGGMEKQAYNLCHGLSKHGIRVTCAVPKTQLTGHEPFPTLGICWPSLKPWLLANQIFSRRVQNHIESSTYDYAISIGFALSAWRSRCVTPLIFHTAGANWYQKQSYAFEAFDPRIHWMKYISKKLISQSSTVIVESHHMEHVLQEQFQGSLKNIKVIYPGINHSKNLNHSVRKRRHALFVGRFTYEKGIDYLKSIGTALLKHNFSLSIVGKGPLLRQLSTLKGKNCTIYEPVAPDKLLNFYQSADFLIVPSRSEGIPQVLLEAMGQGAIPVVSEVGGMLDLIDNKTVFGFPTGDTQACFEWINRIDKWTDEKKHETRKALMKRAEFEFSEIRFLKNYLDLFQKLGH
ncbi:MAG: glycosyltransferase family 4 protein [Bdellovibrionales bacterium]|nr:glycosyltransferase family 4 protein [Bdellovibrionales bacterium]